MRPLTIRMSGVRSYRSEETIDFRDASLMAIVGDTGAGKSSILEALFFALYGGCTWDHRAVVPLISDGVSTMQVELTFSADGRTWRVFRSASRTGGQTRHELVCLDDPTVRFDNDGPVTAEVQRLIGLDRDAFLRTVVLPQGRFQMLLQATRGDRTAILKGIFRLEQLAAVREQADGIARRLRPGLDELKEERATLLPDPAAALAEARQRFEESSKRQGELSAVSQTVTDATKKREDRDREARELDAAAEAVADSLVPSAPDELSGLSEVAERLTKRRNELEEERRRWQTDADALANALRDAEGLGEGLQALAAAATTVKSLREQLPDIDLEHSRCEQEAKAVEDATGDIQRDEAALQELEEHAERLKGEAANAEAALRSARTTLEDARSSLRDVREKTKDASDFRAQRATAADRVARAGEGLARAEQEAQITDARLAEVRQQREIVRRAHSATHAAEGCAPGDPCPVCDRPLPDTFKPREAPDDRKAEEDLSLAEAASRQASNAVAERTADVRNATTQHADIVRGLADAERALAEALDDLRRGVPDAELDSSDEAILEPLSNGVLTAESTHRGIAERVASVGEQVSGARAAIGRQRQEIERRSRDLHARQETLRERRAGWEAAVANLPPRFAIGGRLDDRNLAEALSGIETRQTELSGVADKLDEARRRVQDVGESLEALREEQQREVEVPRQSLIPVLVGVAQRVDDAAARLGTTGAPLRPEGSLLAEAEWSRELQLRASELVAEMKRVVEVRRSERDEAVVVMRQALADAGVDDESALREQIVGVSADVVRAKQDTERAAADLPRAADLDAKVTDVGDLLAAVDELTRLLSDSRFIAYVVTRKQQSLLGVATEILGSMTGNRYGFSEQFEIVDRLSGLPRGVKTLSGGETFLASLALALAMVELAGRAGGRLDALFLDEGFGSLDANALAEALDALGRQADTGRLVAVISHLRSVAENIERVLAVTLGPEGSRAHWLGGDEREELIADEIEAGLLA